MRVNRQFQLFFICLSLFSAALCADEVEYVVSGVDDPMLTNVRNHVSAFRIGSGAKLNSRLRRKLVADAKVAAADAMRPYGYFHPQVNVEIASKEAGKWVLEVSVKAGPPVKVQDLQLELTGPGSRLASLNDWYTGFPLSEFTG
jgi:translocation and assembly module TamA